MLENGSTNKAGTDGTPADITAGTIPEMGIGFCQTIQASSSMYRQQIHYSGDGLLYEMGQRNGITGQFHGNNDNFFV